VGGDRSGPETPKPIAGLTLFGNDLLI